MIERSKQLKYRSIAQELSGFIADSEPGSKLPSERELARSFDCNVLTVRKALASFAADGRIVKCARSGSFVAEAPAIGLKAPMTRDPKRLGVLIHAESDAYALEVLRSVGEYAMSHGVELRSAWYGGGGFERSLQEIGEEMSGQACSALLLPWFPSAIASQVANFVRDSALPVALPDLLPGLERNCFESPDFFGTGTLRLTEAMCRYFLLLGHRRVAFLGPDQADCVTLQRMLGAYSSFICREGMMENLVGLVGRSASEMDVIAERWSAFKGRLAVFCFDDSHAIRFIASMRKLGFSAPEDFSIIGCNNTQEAVSADPPTPFTSGDPAEELGAWTRA
jgi:DNA-binding LacI/PurR family transcriptional regulator